MNKLTSPLRRIATSVIVLIQISSFSLVQLPRTAIAQEAPASCPVVNGTQAPTGADSHTYTFRPADGPAPTCIWESAYYTWDPVTKIYSPKFDDYECHPVTGVCESITWAYVTSDAQFVERRTVVYVPPAPAPTSASTTPTSTATQANDTGNGAEAQSSGTSITSGNGTNSTNTATGNSTTNVNGNLNNNTSLLSTLNSDANSGNASTLFNTSVGDVGTGDATAIANIINMIQSGWDPTRGDLTLFSADLFANYYGDLMFDPSIALGNGTGSSNGITNNTDQTLTLNVSDDASIHNDINLNAGSGDANANGNTTVGNVSTGDANVVANVINMINSMITSGNSFLGSINLYGDLNGDILLPQSIMDILLGNGTGSSNAISGTNNINANIDTSNNSTITNNTDLNAGSGNATADNNTTVGDISTGNAETNVNEMNLVGQNVQAKSGLLVFVNVLGSWVGMLFNGPGATGISAGNGTNSSNTVDSNTNTDIDVTTDQNFGITNNLNLNANSGNATANANTNVGNVSTGDATASANILNLIDSNLNFTDWFGVLFINVFGNWQGSFGVDTANGEQVTGGMGAGTPETNTTADTTANSSAQTSSRGGNNGTAASVATRARQALSAFTGGGNDESESQETVAAAVSDTPTSPDQTQSTSTDISDSDEQVPTVADVNVARNNGAVWWVTGIAGLTSLLLLGGERLLLFVRKP